MPTIIDTPSGTHAVVVERRRTVVVARPVSVAVPISSPGAQGPKGDPGGTTFQRPSAGPMSALRVVYEAGGAVAPADPQDGEQVGAIIGLAVTAAGAPGVPIDIQAQGAVNDAGWAWADGPVFLGPAGTLTQIPPDDGWEVVVGWALSPTRINLTFDEPIEL